MSCAAAQLPAVQQPSSLLRDKLKDSQATSTMRHFFRLAPVPASLIATVVLSALLSGAQGFVHCLSWSSTRDFPHPTPATLSGAAPGSGGCPKRCHGDRLGGAAGALQMAEGPKKKGSGPYKVIATNKWVLLVFKEYTELLLCVLRCSAVYFPGTNLSELL